MVYEDASGVMWDVNGPNADDRWEMSWKDWRTFGSATNGYRDDGSDLYVRDEFAWDVVLEEDLPGLLRAYGVDYVVETTWEIAGLIDRMENRSKESSGHVLQEEFPVPQ